METTKITKITIKGFGLFGYENQIDKTLDFSKNKIIITGNNGTGKTSLINLVFGIITNQSSIYSHVRYKSMEFYFNNGKPIKIKGNSLFFKLKEVSKEKFAKQLSHISTRYLLFEKHWNSLTKKEYNTNFDKTYKQIDIRKWLEDINDKIEKGDNIFKDPDTKILESSWDPRELHKLHFFRGVWKQISGTVNEINNILLNEDIKYYSSIESVSSLLSSKIEYFSIFRNANEYLQKNLDSRYANKENKFLINLELEKPSVEEINYSFTEATINKIGIIKNSFFDSVSNDEWKESVDLDLEWAKEVASRVNDQKLMSLIVNLSTNNDFKNKMIGYLEPLKEVMNDADIFFKKIDVFLEKINSCLLNKKILFQNNSFYIEKNKNKTKFYEAELSAGERQIFKLFTAIMLSDSNIIFMDEPEISLSVRWQQVLREVISEATQNKQILFITHSPYLISRDDISQKIIESFDEYAQ